MRNIRYGLEQLFRRLNKTVSIFFLLFFSLILNQNLILVKIVSEKVQESINIVKVFIQ